MNPLLLSVAVVVSQVPAGEDRRATLDGRWAVVAFERGGESVPAARGATAAVRDNVITFASASRESTGGGGPTGTGSNTGAGPTSRASESGPTVGASMRPFRLEFGPLGTVRVTETDADGKAAGTARGVRSGVYVLTRDYLAVSVHDESGRAVGAPDPAGTPGTAGTGRAAAARKPYLAVILRRADSDTGARSGPGRDR